MTTREIPPGGGTPRDVATALNNALRGKINSVGDVTLTASAASTTVKEPRVGDNSVVLLMPKTANAAAEIGNGTIYIAKTDYVSGTSFKITHANNSQTDRDYSYLIVG